MLADCKGLDILKLLANELPNAEFAIAVCPSEETSFWLIDCPSKGASLIDSYLFA